MKQESRYSDVLSDSQISRMGGYAEGYAAGRASRDGLREALVAISSELYVNVDAATRCRQLAKKALADDEEGK